MRHSTIADAVTGPTPGSASSCSTVAALRSTGAPGAGLVSAGPAGADAEPGGVLTELPMAGGRPGGAAMPTTICSPSATRRAMFNPVMSAPSNAPPAASRASAIRAPDPSVTSPGVRTSPTTLTITVASGAVGDATTVAPVDETGCTAGRLADTTRGGSWFASVKTVTRTATSPITPSATTPARPGSARMAASQLDPPPAAVSGSHRDSDVSVTSSSDSVAS